jgi:Protein of unknown function, DUF547
MNARCLSASLWRVLSAAAALCIGVLWMPTPVVHAGQEGQQPGSDVDALHAPWDRLLDVHVRDGLVYYRALKGERGRLDRYVASLDVPQADYERWAADRKLAFWINAYNAFVVDTVIDRYPIRGKAPEYPANSIRQISGAFDKLPHRAAGRSVTLDEIEKTILPEFKEPRAYLALGRGSVGGGRLHSGAYTSGRLNAQLDRVAAECVTRQECVRIDAGARTMAVTPIFSWREREFVEILGQKELSVYPGRSPLERAILVLIAPHLLPGERMTLQQNDFTITFTPYDWRLNDLTGGPPPR